MKAKNRKRLWIRLVIYLGVLPLFYFGLCWFLASGYVKPSRNVAQLKPDSMGEVTIDHAPHGLVAWASQSLIDGEPKHDTVVILVHGYGGNRDHWPSLIEYLEVGAEIVAPAMHGQDASLAEKVGFGPGEAAEIISAAQWARKQYDDPPRVVLFGVSLGGSACWLAVGESPELFDAVVSEAAFTTLDKATEEFFDSNFGNLAGVMQPVVWFSNRQAGIDPSTVRPIDAAKEWDGPALVIHGNADTLLGTPNADQLVAASGAELWLVDGLRHAQLAGEQAEELAGRILEFGQTQAKAQRRLLGDN